MSKKLLIFPVFLLAIILFSGCGNKEMEKAGAPVSDQMDQKMEKKTDMTQEVKTGYVDISPEEAKKMIDENQDLIVIDVSPNYDRGHLPGAINYYLGDGSLDKAIPELDKEADYLVYCHVDSVAIAGAKKLVEAGFMNVYRLEGNYQAWIDAGYPIEK